MVLRTNSACKGREMTKGDHAFRKARHKGRWQEMTYGGALSVVDFGYVSRGPDHPDKIAPANHRNGMGAAIEVARDRAGDVPVYISFDVDGMDPAYASGTGMPVHGCLASRQAVEFVRGMKGLNLIGMDVVEASPAYDTSEITASAAAMTGWALI